MPDKIGTTDGRDDLATRKTLPSVKFCRTRKIGEIQAFGACEVPDPDCKFAIPAAIGNFCSNPHWKDFMRV